MGKRELVMRTIVKFWEEYYSRLGEINLERPKKNRVIRATMKPKIYKAQAMAIVERLAPQDSILEIGCGYGGLAHEILKEKKVSYTVVDNKIMLAQAKRLLGDKIEYIEASFIETLHGRKFGLFISHWCLSETPAEYREYILEHIIKNCQKISVMDFQDEQMPNPAMISNGYEIVPLRIEKWIGKYFIIKKTLLSKRHFKQFSYVGERKR